MTDTGATIDGSGPVSTAGWRTAEHRLPNAVIHLLPTILVLAAIAVLGGLVVAYPLSLGVPA